IRIWYNPREFLRPISALPQRQRHPGRSRADSRETEKLPLQRGSPCKASSADPGYPFICSPMQLPGKIRQPNGHRTIPPEPCSVNACKKPRKSQISLRALFGNREKVLLTRHMRGASVTVTWLPSAAPPTAHSSTACQRRHLMIARIITCSVI